jgi:hypothetical protein
MSGTPLLLRPEELAYKPSKEKKQFKIKLPKKLPKGRNLFLIVFALIILEGAGTEAYLYYSHLPKKPKPIATVDTVDTTKQQLAEIKKKRDDLVNSVKTQVELPKDEEPTLATVSDPSALKNQNFFSEAEVGDKILMYRKHKQAYLFRPSTQSVIAQAELQYQDSTVAGASTSAAQEPGHALGPGRVLVRPGDTQQ